MPDAAVAKLAELLDRTASDPAADPTDRLSALRDLRDELATLVGQADSYIADQQAVREADAMDRVRDFVAARENAGARGTMIARGMASPEALDAAGMVDHDELDRRERDGTIDEAVDGAGAEDDADDVEEGVLDRLTPAGRTDRDGLAGVLRDRLSQPSTADVYSRSDETGRRVYSKSRRALHKRIVDDALTGHSRQDKPKAVFVGGGAASGKRTLRKALTVSGVAPEDVVSIDAADIREQIPERANMVEGRDPEANLAVHEEADDIAGQILKEARGRKLNVIADGLGGDGCGVLAKADKFKRAGYETSAHYATVPGLEAVERSDGRPDRVTEAVTRATHRDVAEAIPTVMKGSQGSRGLDELHVWDTGGKDAKPLYSLRDGKGTVHDEDGLRKVLNKANDYIGVPDGGR